MLSGTVRGATRRLPLQHPRVQRSQYPARAAWKPRCADRTCSSRAAFLAGLLLTPANRTRRPHARACAPPAGRRRRSCHSAFDGVAAALRSAPSTPPCTHSRCSILRPMPCSTSTRRVYWGVPQGALPLSLCFPLLGPLHDRFSLSTRRRFASLSSAVAPAAESCDGPRDRHFHMKFGVPRDHLDARASAHHPRRLIRCQSDANLGPICSQSVAFHGTIVPPSRVMARGVTRHSARIPRENYRLSRHSGSNDACQRETAQKSP